MSRRKENVRKACRSIDDRVLKAMDCINTGYISLAKDILSTIRPITHRIKRTTWRGDETNLNKRITDDIKQIAMRSFKNDLSNFDINDCHPPATDW